MPEKITDLSAEEPTDSSDNAYARTRMRSTVELGAKAGVLSATVKAETDGPANHTDVATISRGLGLACAIVLGLLPGCGTGVLCAYVHAPAWIVIVLPVLIWAITTIATVRYMRRK